VGGTSMASALAVAARYARELAGYIEAEPGAAKCQICARFGRCPAAVAVSPWGMRLGDEDDGHGAGPLGGLTGIVGHRPDCGPANDAVDDRTVEPLPDPASAGGAHVALDRSIYEYKP
jgi:hypothetical protein